jgi:glutathione S-transferase
MSVPKLYYTTTSCGAASYIAAKLGGIAFDSEVVDIRAGKTASGAEFEAVNWKGNVPTLVLPDGSTLSENVSCLLWISDNAVNKWGPAQGSAAWFEMVDNLAYVNTAIHGGLFKNLFYAPSEEAKVPLRAQLATELGWLVKFALKGKKFLGSQFTVADIYLYICLSWAPYVGVTLSDDVTAYFKSIQAIDGVGSVHQALNTPAK